MKLESSCYLVRSLSLSISTRISIADIVCLPEILNVLIFLDVQVPDDVIFLRTGVNNIGFVLKIEKS